LAIAILTVACGQRASEQQSDVSASSNSHLNVAPLVTIDLKPVSTLRRPLEFHWRISNAASEPVYVYSTLLRQPAGAEIDVDAQQSMIEIRFLRLQPIAVGVNSFPEAGFMQIAPNEAKEGRFQSAAPVAQVSKEIKPGNWRVRIRVAYGYEIESLKNALAQSLARGEEHPINPIVRWQKISYSDPVSVTF